jgi:uncharacterized protein YdhG (YjbR/CyaY superfamily)
METAYEILTTLETSRRPSHPAVAHLPSCAPPAARRHLQKPRQAIREAAPGADGTFGYGMPAFALDAKPFVWYAAWKQHSSFYPLSKATTRALAAQLAPFDISGKGTIRFRLDQPPQTTTSVGPEGKPGPRRDLATIIAISIIAFAIANLLHEGVGHSGACALMGGHAKVLSSAYTSSATGTADSSPPAELRLISSRGSCVGLPYVS